MPDQPQISTAIDLLANRAYSSDCGLRARQSLYRWQKPTYDLVGIVAAQLAEVHGTLVDVGCGNGTYLKGLRSKRPDLHIIGLDLSVGILAGLDPPLVVAGAMHLPFADDRLDAVLAMHMLYHLRDVQAGITELTRVVRKAGVLVVSTNSREDKIELDHLWSAAAADVLGVSEGPRRVSLSSRFTLEDAPVLLEAHFTNINVVRLPGLISVEQKAPILTHLASYRAWSDEMGVPFDATLKRVSERLDAHLGQFGRFEITCLGGIVVCRDQVVKA